MKTMLLVLAFIPSLLVNSASAQTASEIRKAYGKPLDIYSVSEHIWMTPEYGADGQVCRMRLYSKQIDENANYVSSRTELNLKEVESFLNQLVPPNTRGLKNESFGQTATGGSFAWTVFEYEKVRFTFVAPFGSFAYDGTTIKKGEFVFTVPEGPIEEPSRLPADNDFSTQQTIHTQIVSILWKQRKCMRD